MNPDNKYQKWLEQAEPLTMTDKMELEQKLQFTYCPGIGEIICAIITCRLDISYAIIKFSQDANKPAALHFQACFHLH